MSYATYIVVNVNSKSNCTCMILLFVMQAGYTAR